MQLNIILVKISNNIRNTVMPKNQIHHGRNLKRIREILGMKQEALAMELGGNWNQQKISLLEQKEELSRNMLEKVARALKISVNAIMNFTEETAILSIQQNPEIAISGGESVDSYLNTDYSASSRVDKWQV